MKIKTGSRVCCKLTEEPYRVVEKNDRHFILHDVLESKKLSVPKADIDTLFFRVPLTSADKMFFLRLRNSSKKLVRYERTVPHRLVKKLDSLIKKEKKNA